MIGCTSCGRENEDHYKFCLGCGSPLPRPEPKPEPQQATTLNCPHCGTIVPRGFKFCGACGGSLPADAPAPAAAPVASAPAPTIEELTPQPLADAPSGGFERESTSRYAQDALAGGPAPGAPVDNARLVVIRPDGTEAATLALTNGAITLGRRGLHPVLDEDLFLSPEHASISNESGQYTVVDHDSLNGVYVRIYSEVELLHGDFVRIGQELLQFHMMDQLRPIDAVPEADRDTLRGGSPDIGYWGRLSLISGPDLATRAYVFSEDQIEIGRERGDILFQEDGFVSGRHARISKTEGRVILKDLGSSNGTYVRIKGEHPIQDGELLLMGQQLFRFSL